MKKLIFVLTAAILLFMTACDGAFVDPGAGGGFGVGGGTHGKPPATPTGVFAAATSSNSITVIWLEVSKADSYRIYRSTNLYGTYYSVGSSYSIIYTDTGLSPSTTYYYKVSAENDYGESDQSAFAFATTPGPTYTVNFSSNGGTGTVASISATSGSSITLPSGSGLSRTGYTFGGWSTSSSGTGTPHYHEGASYTVNGNITFYAVWSTYISGSGTETDSYQLTNGVWANGSITSTASGTAVWYSFSVTNGTTYYVWWNDSYSLGGNGTKTLDVDVSAYYSDGSTVFAVSDSAWSTPKSFTASSTGTVKLKVTPYYSGSTGTFAIAYRASSNTRPN